jgi:hypothetical protein
MSQLLMSTDSTYKVDSSFIYRGEKNSNENCISKKWYITILLFLTRSVDLSLVKINVPKYLLISETPTVTSNKFWSSRSFQNFVRLSQL